MIRHAEKIVGGDYLVPCVLGEVVDGGISLDFIGGEAFITKHGLKQIRYVLSNHVDLLQALLNNNAYEDVVESLARISKEVG